MNIIILGYGTIGSGIREIINHAVAKNTKQLHASHILIRKGKTKALLYTCSGIRTILQDTSVGVTVGTMGSLEPAHVYVLQVSKSGKHVVIASKVVIATYSKEFTDVAGEHNVHIYYEASAGDDIPWIEGLAKTMRINEVDHTHDISNGTGNYILDHVQCYHVSFEDILKEAQEPGYAEADPSTDIGSYGICNKLRISASLAYDYRVPDAFPVFGIRNIARQDVSYFSPLGYTIRLIARTRRNANRYGCVVEPVLFETSSLENNTQDNYSLITLHGKTIGDLKFFGQGVGRFPTIDAIVQDLIDLERGVCHMDPSFTSTVSYDEALCLHDYTLRVDGAVHNRLQDLGCEMKTFEGWKYLHIQKAEVCGMYQVMEQVPKIDVHAFMASIYERESD